MECNIHNGAIRWQMSTSIKVIAYIFTLALTHVSDILKFEISDHENLGQGHTVQQ